MELISLPNICELITYFLVCKQYTLTVLNNSLNTTSQYTFNYNTYGVTCVEVEIDVLTGQTEVLRVDILYDCGERLLIILQR